MLGLLFRLPQMERTKLRRTTCGLSEIEYMWLPVYELLDQAWENSFVNVVCTLLKIHFRCFVDLSNSKVKDCDPKDRTSFLSMSHMTPKLNMRWKIGRTYRDSSLQHSCFRSLRAHGRCSYFWGPTRAIFSALSIIFDDPHHKTWYNKKDWKMNNSAIVSWSTK